MNQNDNLEIRGARQNNLKEISLDIPLHKTVVITGPSGSGKSSLAFETLYAEGQRRYMQSLSTYSRQFLDKFKPPDVDQIKNIPPTIALEQINPVRNSRATVGTTTEIYDYLRLLFEKIGIQYCENCNIPLEKLTLSQMTEWLIANARNETLILASPKEIPTSKNLQKETLEMLLQSGYLRLLWKGEIHLVENLLQEKTKVPENVDVVLDRVKVEEPLSSLEVRLNEGLNNSLQMGSGVAHVYTEKDGNYTFLRDFVREARCPKCKSIFPAKSAGCFSFNSPLGACENCKGFGNTLEIDEGLVVPNPRLTLAQGAIEPFTKPSMTSAQKKLFEFCKKERIDADLQYQELSTQDKAKIWNGGGKFPGVKGIFKHLESDKYKVGVRVFLSRYQSPVECSICHGSRLKKAALLVKLHGKTIAELCKQNLEELLNFFETLPLTPNEKIISKDILDQLLRRLRILNQVGLGYLQLFRLTKSVSGGEYQRILLSTQLSQGLTDTLYVLDEPSIGLHPRDTEQLLSVLSLLQSQGNSLVVVEHDPEVILWAEHVVDMGPGSGTQGGEVLFAGSQASFKGQSSPTALSLKHWRDQCQKLLPGPDDWKKKPTLELIGASENNLKDVNVSFPLGCLIAVTGVSGSGKSTLIVDTLYQALAKVFQGRSEKMGKFKSIKGFDHLQAIELMDQSPIGKSSRSNPVTYLKAYDSIRSLLASTPDAERMGLTPGHFSFNVKGGRCDRCEGEGRIQIDMVFMEDVYIPCPECDSKRFKPSILSVKYKGKNIDDCLRMTVSEALPFFQHPKELQTKLRILSSVGLGYLQLGQPAHTLSGGEAQRLKIARELADAKIRDLRTLYILDEPTTGLHFQEVMQLIRVLKQLVYEGHTVVVIEHSVQLMCAAHYLIDLGPEGGEAGGRVVASGSPQEVSKIKASHTGRFLGEILRD